MAASAAVSYHDSAAPDDNAVPGAGPPSPLHPLVDERVLGLALRDARNFAIRRLRRSLGQAAQPLCEQLALADALPTLVSLSQRASTILIDRLGEYEARAFVAAVRHRLAYANPSWQKLLEDVPMPTRITLL